MGRAHGFRQGANGSAQLAEIRVAVAGLNALESRAQLRIVGDRLREQFQLCRPAPMICAFCARRPCGERRQRLLFCVSKPRTGAHAE